MGAIFDLLLSGFEFMHYFVFIGSILLLFCFILLFDGMCSYFEGIKMNYGNQCFLSYYIDVKSWGNFIVLF